MQNLSNEHCRESTSFEQRKQKFVASFEFEIYFEFFMLSFGSFFLLPCLVYIRTTVGDMIALGWVCAGLGHACMVRTPGVMF